MTDKPNDLEPVDINLMSIRKHLNAMRREYITANRDERRLIQGHINAINAICSIPHLVPWPSTTDAANAAGETSDSET